jgi:hypothetical protein
LWVGRWLTEACDDVAKKDRPPLEVCNYCNHEVVCAWTVRWHACEYAMCEKCCVNAEMDNFSYRMRTAQDRESKSDD